MPCGDIKIGNFMLDTNSLLVGLLLGSIGMGYCLYGKKQSHFIAFLVGLLLMGLPYVVDNNIVLLVVSAALMVLPRYVKL